MIDVNTTSKYPTHFLRAVEIIIHARTEYNVPSENWAHPTQYNFGIPNDHYYGEIWIDGMDWQPSYWVIEEYQLNKPVVQPFIIFESNEERENFNSHDFTALVGAMLYYRRDKLWVEKNDYGYYTDSVWPYINLVDNKIKFKTMKKYYFQHASQNRVEFWANIGFIPEVYREKKKNNRDDWDEEKKHNCSIPTNKKSV